MRARINRLIIHSRLEPLDGQVVLGGHDRHRDQVAQGKGVIAQIFHGMKCGIGFDDQHAANWLVVDEQGSVSRFLFGQQGQMGCEQQDIVLTPATPFNKCFEIAGGIKHNPTLQLLFHGSRHGSIRFHNLPGGEIGENAEYQRVACFGPTGA